MNYSTLIKLANQLAEAEMLKELEGGDAMDGSDLDDSDLDGLDLDGLDLEGIDPEILEALIADAEGSDEGVDPVVLEALMQDTEEGIDPELLQALLEQEGGLEGGLEEGEDLDPELVQALIEQEGAEKEAAFNEKVAYLHQVYDAFMQKEAELNYREALLDAAEGNGMDKTASLVKEAQLEQALAALHELQQENRYLLEKVAEQESTTNLLPLLLGAGGVAAGGYGINKVLKQRAAEKILQGAPELAQVAGRSLDIGKLLKGLGGAAAIGGLGIAGAQAASGLYGQYGPSLNIAQDDIYKAEFEPLLKELERNKSRLGHTRNQKAVRRMARKSVRSDIRDFAPEAAAELRARGYSTAQKLRDKALRNPSLVGRKTVDSVEALKALLGKIRG